MNYHVDNIKNIELFFKSLRNDICNSFENIENSNPKNKNKPHKTFNFKRRKWKRKADKGFASGGGGVISIMKGKVFEKVGVNISSVQGRFSTEMRKKIPGAYKKARELGRGRTRSALGITGALKPVLTTFGTPAMTTLFEVPFAAKRLEEGETMTDVLTVKLSKRL